MNDDIVRFLRAQLDADEHRFVMITSTTPPGTDVVLDSTIPMIDMVRAVTDLYAPLAHLDTPATPAASEGEGFDAGRAAGLGEAAGLLARIYDESPAYREQWRPRTPPRR